MSSTAARTRTRRALRRTAVGLVVVSAAISASLVHLSASFASPSSGTAHSDGHGARITEADGVVPEDVTVFDDEYSAVAHLDADLLRALRAAATEAADDGIELIVNSGWRSPEYQDQLLQEAVVQYGSAEEAARWVATAATSAHVSGDAVDVGHSEAQEWLSEQGAGYGLCQVYRNEPWHYELRPDAAEQGCPSPYADPTQDPRMQQ